MMAGYLWFLSAQLNSRYCVALSSDRSPSAMAQMPSSSGQVASRFRAMPSNRDEAFSTLVLLNFSSSEALLLEPELADPIRKQ